jgi:hypothetical protein
MLLSLLAMVASLLASCAPDQNTARTYLSTVPSKTLELRSVVRSGGFRAVRTERPPEAGLDIVGDGEDCSPCLVL